MVLKKLRAHWPLRALLVAVLVIAGLIRAAGEAAAAEDLGLLKTLSSTQNYEALVRTVQSRHADHGDLTFIVLGDSRGNMEMAQKVYRQAAREKPAFILHTGDFVSHGEAEEYLQYHEPLLKELSPIPLIPVPGNHERGPGKDFKGFLAIYGSDRVSFDVAGCRFIGVNNSAVKGLTDDALQFIAREIAKPPKQVRTFVFMHYPPLYVEQSSALASEEVDYRGFTQNQHQLRDLFKGSRVQGAFFGHDHGFAAREIDGVHYFITAGAGADLHEKMKWLDPVHHYLVVRASPTSIRYELVRLDNSENGQTRVPVGESKELPLSD